MSKNATREQGLTLHLNHGFQPDTWCAGAGEI